MKASGGNVRQRLKGDFKCVMCLSNVNVVVSSVPLSPLTYYLSVSCTNFGSQQSVCFTASQIKLTVIFQKHTANV